MIKTDDDYFDMSVIKIISPIILHYSHVYVPALTQVPINLLKKLHPILIFYLDKNITSSYDL